jgi:hypothetical protein
MIIVVAISAAGWRSVTSVPGAPARTFSWQTQMATLSADQLTIEAGGRTFEAPRDVDYVISDPGGASYRTLELAWHDDGIEMRLNLYLAADANDWWVTQVRTYDGRDPGDWIYYLGPLIRAPLGEAFTGDVDLLGVGFNGVGRLRIAALSLRAFEPGTIPPRFDSCRAVGPIGGGGLFGRPVGREPHPDLSEFGIAEGMEASDVQQSLESRGICHEFRLEFPSINRGQIWCTAPPGRVREFAVGSAGDIIVFVEDRSRLPRDTELPQVVGC